MVTRDGIIAVYIVASRKYGTLYIGVTSDLARRAYEHREGAIPGFSNNLVRLLCARLRLANEQIQSLSSLDVAGRVARQLLAFAERYGQEEERGTRISLRLTQSDLAQLVGASRERVNQIMVDLRQKGLIALEPGQQLVVLDAAGLARLCH